MRVGEIKKLPSGKYKIKIGDQFITTYDDVILKNHLLFQKEIGEAAYQKLEIDNLYADVYHKMLQYVTKKIRSHYEVNLYLEKFDIPSTEKEKIKEHLETIGLLSDRSYVKAYLSDSLYLSNDGPNKIQNYLLAQEIDENLIAEEMEKIDVSYVEEKLTKLIQKRILHDHKHSNYQLQQKIILDMVNLGYSKDMILQILSTCSFQDTEKLEKEYEIQYNRLRRKYSDKDLTRKIKEKLYSKGFDINQIEELLQKKS